MMSRALQRRPLEMKLLVYNFNFSPFINNTNQSPRKKFQGFPPENPDLKP